MRRAILLFLLGLMAAVPVSAQDLHRPVGQVPLLPLPESGTGDIEAFLRRHWQDYWQSQGPHGFDRTQVRVGRFDLDGDGTAELFVMIDAPQWVAADGKPLAVATWRGDRWQAVGWAWGDEDTVFVTAERLGGWRSIDTGPHWLRMTGSVYSLERKQ